MSNFICNKCRICSKFPFCNVTESKDGNCGDYIQRDRYKFIKNRLKSIDYDTYLKELCRYE